MRVEVFDDWKSVIHAILGFIACLNPIWLIAGSVVYLLYECFTSKRLDELVGDILEFSFGAYAWCIVYAAWLLLTSIA